MSEPTSTRDDRHRPRVLPGTDRPLRSDPLVWIALFVAAIVATIMVAPIGTDEAATEVVDGAGRLGELCIASGASWCIAEPPGWVLWLFAVAVLTPLVVVVLGSVRAFIRGYRGT
jgi:hypothetical protein